MLLIFSFFLPSLRRPSDSRRSFHVSGSRFICFAFVRPCAPSLFQNPRRLQGGQNKDQQGDQKQNPQEGKGDKEDQGDQQGQPTPSGISPQEQQQMLDAIQAQEDKTQEKLKEKQGVVVRGKKNW